MEQRRILCFVDYDSRYGAGSLRDPAATSFWPDSELSRYRVAARGIEYVGAGDLEDFERQCGEVNLEWVPVLDLPGQV